MRKQSRSSGYRTPTAGGHRMDVQDDIVKEFLVESTENLDRVDRDLISLEKEPSSQEILARIFRAIHTIKGTTGFLGFSELESVAHVGEKSPACRPSNKAPRITLDIHR